MRIVADTVSKGTDGIPLPETSLVFETGRVTVAVAETGDHPTVLSLVASGRMVPDAGAVTLDGVADAALVRERIALVDAPEVSEPAADLLLRWVVREELMYAGRSTSRQTVTEVIDQAGGSRYAGVRMGDVPAGVRVRVLTELAAFRRGVQGLVITSPDRHGGDPREWLAVATDLAARDFAVLVVCGEASAEIVGPLLPEPARLPEPEPLAEAEPAASTSAPATPQASVASSAPTASTPAHAAAPAPATAESAPAAAPASTPTAPTTHPESEPTA
ncbi:hypothetical protein [Herbiconiux ginsengi]|uniref:ABC transporter ATP-binding protein n=1 Tax=Herbiconiux ginsengi TaxID=381665 RepID=A0A1H3MKQ9_9MICO|nr:hypothetical protein [Herbiconiux ginsengi]SDY77173.1 hypothetical protein SAMN05216554_1464 [Herbiconiux ginsengi]